MVADSFVLDSWFTDLLCVDYISGGTMQSSQEIDARERKEMEDQTARVGDDGVKLSETNEDLAKSSSKRRTSMPLMTPKKSRRPSPRRVPWFWFYPPTTPTEFLSDDER